MSKKESALSKALHYLSWRSRTQFEILTYLKDKGYDKNEIQEALNRLSDYGYANDEKYVNQVSENIKTNPRKGKYSIKSKIQHKGVSDELICRAISNYDDSIDLDKAFLLAKSTFEHSQRLTWKKIIDKIFRQLSSKGFSSEVIQKTIKKIEHDPLIAQLYEARQDIHKEYAFLHAKKVYDQWRKKEKDRHVLRSKIQRSLYQKGYSTDIIYQTTNIVMEDDS
ncbi:SOS response regulatory protein OraA/RecX, interacts with RecA [Tindallia magadiensis]|uniref:Regulatory protein RecX n=1 Tax=Tindallia magadiensis TaxID=69895 RepID=A0A1I3AEI8_9FIRM|nr:RecX family transcriptional regulator [Tindallia magadiensis]SFH48547.1 SOS response regulatory protein OraA/RecX, interacts with RecA [Tindallia magadiensis]